MSSFLVFFLSLPSNALVSTTQALEVLSMPVENRVEVAYSKKEEMYPTLIQLAFSDQHSIPMRWRALNLAAEINKKGSLSDVKRALKTGDWFMKNAALMALSRSNPQESQKAALSLLADKALVVRSTAVHVLPEQMDVPVRKRLWDEMKRPYNFRKEQSLWIRGQIIEKLAQHPATAEYTLFAEALRDPDERLHRPAMLALEKLTHKKLGDEKSTYGQMKDLWRQFVGKNPKL